MRLQWKYALIINLSVLILLAAFYMLLNIKAVDDLGNLYEKGLTRGAIFKEITEKTIRPLVEDEMASKEIAERTVPPLVEDKIEDRQALYREKLEGALRQLKQDKPNEMRDVLDINVTFGMDAKIQASLIPDKEADDYINLTNEGLYEIRQNGFELYRTPQINGRDATAVIIPYSVEFVGEEFDTEPIDGFIQALFAGPDLANHLYRLRAMLLISIIVLSVLLVIIIDMTTTRLVIRPLQGMMEIIRRAEAGTPESLPQSYASDEIGRVTYSLVRMLRQLTGTHAKRIAALQQFAAGVAHEIRNPLNTIGMTAQHLLDLFSNKKIKSSDLEEARNLLDIVNFEIQQLQRISEQFVTLNRPKTIELESTNLDALIDQVGAEFTLMTENAKVRIITTYTADLPQIQLDPGLMRQTLFNLIQNSIQAMPKGGRIYITTQHSQTFIGNEIKIEIRDTGVGIPREIQERVFDAYFTTKESEGGMGLGLALAHQIITAHQGRIELRSQVGMGTAFQIYLPLKPPTHALANKSVSHHKEE